MSDVPFGMSIHRKDPVIQYQWITKIERFRILNGRLKLEVFNVYVIGCTSTDSVPVSIAPTLSYWKDEARVFKMANSILRYA